ncbi:RtcB family protein, partial [Fibrobacterota bacterium]
VDIGCGMSAVQTNRAASDTGSDEIRDILGALKSIVPVGFKHHKQNQQWDGFERAPDLPVIRRELPSARKQLGTLGGGNHFIELQKGSDGCIWLMLHSGSRNFGYKIAREYNNQAQDYCKKRYGRRFKYKGGDGLAFLPEDSKLFHEYCPAMDFSLAFAYANRQLMMKRFKDCAYDVLGCGFTREINIHHNFAASEHHFGREVMVHRKGATRADKGRLGIIPGSMGTASYIVQGLGNPESFKSCSHGAGRLMGRRQFNRTHTAEECNRAMGDIVYDKWMKKKKGADLSEAPQAYKDIHLVIESQKDLVEVVTRLEPLGVMKG